MVHLSGRTLEGLRRAYESSLDSLAKAYRSVESDSALGRTTARTPLVGGVAFSARVDPVIREPLAVEGGTIHPDEYWISVPTSVTELEPGDFVDILDDSLDPVESYVVTAAPTKRETPFDMQYKAVRA